MTTATTLYTTAMVAAGLCLMTAAVVPWMIGVAWIIGAL